MAVLLVFLLLAPKPWSFPMGPDFFGPRERPLVEHAWIASWWAAALNAALALLFFASAPLWAGPSEEAPLARRPHGRALWVGLLAAVLLAGALRWPLSGSGLWSDEAWTAQYTIAGQWKPARDGSGALVAKTPTWAETLWAYWQPTNQVLYSVVGRATIEAWRSLSGRAPPAFDERVLRLPAFVAALGSVLALGLLLAEWGFPQAGVAAGFLLAIHPWAIRFGADGRSYSFVIALAALAALLLTRALRGGGWARWWRYGAVVFAMLWSHLFSAYLVVTLAAGAGLALLSGPGSPRTKRAQLGRLVVVNAAAVMLVFQLMAPNLAQTRQWRGIFIGDVQTAHLTVPALGHLWSLASLGMEAREPDVPERAPGLYPSLAATPWRYAVALGVMPLLIALGALRLWRRNGPERWVAVGLASGIPLALLFNWINQDQWYPRFGTYWLPVTTGFAALGLDALVERVSARDARVRAAGLAVGLVAFQLCVWPQTRVYLTRPHTPSRAVAQLFERGLGPGPGRGIRAAFGNVDGDIVMAAYDPWLRVPTNASGVQALVDEARAREIPLVLVYGHPARNRRAHPNAMRLFDDRSLFREVATLDAIEVEHLMRVLELRTAAGADPSDESAPHGDSSADSLPPIRNSRQLPQ